MAEVSIGKGELASVTQHGHLFPFVVYESSYVLRVVALPVHVSGSCKIKDTQCGNYPVSVSNGFSENLNGISCNQEQCALVNKLSYSVLVRHEEADDVFLFSLRTAAQIDHIYIPVHKGGSFSVVSSDYVYIRAASAEILNAVALTVDVAILGV